MAEKMRMDNERIFGITKLKLQAFSLAALKMILGDIVVKVKKREKNSVLAELLDGFAVRIPDVNLKI